MEEIEKVDLDKRVERERFWIENTENCVNHNVPGRTQAEYRQEIRERYLEYQKAYRLANLDKAKAFYLAKLKARRSERITCPTCGQNLAKGSLAKHKKLHLSKVETLPQME
jgi:hypothetical protein